MTDSQLNKREEDIQKLIAGGCHLGGKNCTKQMAKYVWDKKSSGVYMFNVQKQFEKIQAAARIIASIPDPSTITAVSGRLYGQRAVYKFSKYTKSVCVTGRWTPGMLTNQNTKTFVEPRLLILTDPRIDYNALLESSYVNIPIIALCNTDNNLQYVDCAIPCNNRSKKSLAMIYWLLTREVLALKGELEEGQFNELPDLFMYRNVEKKEEKTEEEAAKEEEGADDEKEDEGEENFIEEEAS
jgi:small subunit ribosomal protein SAe